MNEWVRIDIDLLALLRVNQQIIGLQKVETR